MAMKILGHEDNLAKQLNAQTKSMAQGIYSMPAFVPQFSGGGLVKPAPQLAPGLIEGPGTGTSDSIEAQLPVDGFVIPAAVVEFYGADFFERMNASASAPVSGAERLSTGASASDPVASAERGRSSGAERLSTSASAGASEVSAGVVDAQVSDGEVFMSPAAVQVFGADAFNKLIASVTGEGAQPEMMEGEVHAARGYDPDALERINKLTGVTGGKQASVPLSAEKAAAQLQPAPKVAPQLDPVQKTINSTTGVAGRGQGSVPMSAEMAKTQAAGNPVYKNAQAGTQAAELRARVPQLGTTNTTNEPFVRTKPGKMGKLAGALADPVNLGFAADSVNQALLERDINSGDIGPGTVARGALSLVSRAPKLIAENVMGGIAPDSPAAKFGKWATTPVDFSARAEPQQQPAALAPENANRAKQPQLAVNAPNAAVSKTGSISYPKDGAGFVPAQTVSRLAAENSQAKTLVPPSPATSAPLSTSQGRSQGWAENGLRTDNTPQTLDWNESRFSNSGDPEQDAALEYRRGINAQNMQNFALVNAGLPPQALVTDNAAARNAGENTRAAQALAGENSRAAQNNATELEKVRILAASRADSKDKKPDFKPAFKEADLDYLDPDTPDDEKLAVGRVDKRAADKLTELYLSTDDPEERSKYVLQLSQLSGVSPANLTNLMLKKTASPQE